MKKKSIICLSFLLFLVCQVYAQKVYQVTGKVETVNGEPLPGAIIWVDAQKKAVVSNNEGRYVFMDIPFGKIIVAASFLGYKPYVDTFLIDRNTNHVIVLQPALQTLQEVTVVDDYAETLRKTDSRNIEVVNSEFIQQQSGGSLMQSLKRLPGVSAFEIGSGQAKPVIRGLSFNRVLVAENGMKHEAQQWGADHGLEIDQNAVQRIEVVKGPAALQYGAEAIGGVVNIQSAGIPVFGFKGALQLTGKSNNSYGGLFVQTSYRKKHFFAEVKASLSDFADYSVPVNSVNIYTYKVDLQNHQVRNTAGKEKNAHLVLGWNAGNFTNRLLISRIGQKMGMFANAAGLHPLQADMEHDNSSRDLLNPQQAVVHTKFMNIAEYRTGKQQVNFTVGYQQNNRKEFMDYASEGGDMPPSFPAGLSIFPGLEKGFLKTVWTAKAEYFCRFSGQFSLKSGVDVLYQDNDISGWSFLIPAFTQWNGGGYVLSTFKVNKIHQFSGGIRFDFGKLNTEAYYNWYYPYTERAIALNRNFSQWSWSVGYNGNREHFQWKANAGRSFRMPLAQELAAQGLNYHFFREEKGNPDLQPETSYQLDLGVDFHLPTFALGLSPFVNYFTNYIYLNPGTEFNQLQVFTYTQAKVFRYGGEVHAHFQPFEWLKTGMILEAVYAQQLSGVKKGYSLPFSPPESAVLNVKYLAKDWKVFSNTSFGIDWVLTNHQEANVPPEIATPGYQLFDIDAGGTLELGKNELQINVKVKNLLNKEYYNHSAYYRLINLPEPGRNFVLNLNYKF
jgi:iron complex outermembrane receptor protein